MPDKELLNTPAADPPESLSRWSALARLLTREGVLGASSIVDAEVTIRDASSRNRNAIVSRSDGPGLFVKRGEAARREAEWYRRLAAIPAVAPLLPTIVRSGASDGLLVLRAEEGARDLWTHHLAQDGFPIALGREVGRALSVLHAETLAGPAPAPSKSPSILGIHRPSVEAWRGLSQGSVELVTIIQEEAGLGVALDGLRAAWEPHCLVHGDVKWSNVLAVPRGREHGPAIRLVDWEYAANGDPAWDLGSALAAYVVFWLYSISPTDSVGPAGLAAAARFPLGVMRPAIACLWQAYLEEAPASTDAPSLRRRAAGYCAARLIQTAFEESETRENMSGRAALHLQVAANVLDDVDAGAIHLLGLEAGGV